jgi:hypothetical protein
MHPSRLETDLPMKAHWIVSAMVLGSLACLPCKKTCDGDSCTETGSCPAESTPTTPAQAEHDAGVPACAPHDPDKHKAAASGVYTFAALPVGACQGAVMCYMAVYGPCFDDPEYVGHPYNVYTCSCTAGAWSCAVSSAGASICRTDAGADLAPSVSAKHD